MRRCTLSRFVLAGFEIWQLIALTVANLICGCLLPGRGFHGGRRCVHDYVTWTEVSLAPVLAFHAWDWPS